VPLLLMTPDADPLVERRRVEHDWAARYGVSAHVTVRTPFLEPTAWGDVRDGELSELLPVELTLARLENRPGALVILVEPDGHLRELTDAIGFACPGLPPHKPGYERPAYHITVARTPDAAVRRSASEAIAPRLPMQLTGTSLWAAFGSPEEGLIRRVIASVGGI
jgi:hypothetical protein